MPGNVVTLGSLVGSIERLEVRCTRCSRHGRYRLTRLIGAHGADTGLPELGSRLAADCPNAKAHALHERCSVEFPQLAVQKPT
jgi:hypothetical protein